MIILIVTGNVAVAGADINGKLAFKNCAVSRKCRTQINDTIIDEAEYINTAMRMYNLIEYSDYSDTSRSLWQFKGDKIEGNADLTFDAQYIPNNSS